MAAADLHQLVVAAGLDVGEDLAGQRAAQPGVAELVDVLHAALALVPERLPANDGGIAFGQAAVAARRTGS